MDIAVGLERAEQLVTRPQVDAEVGRQGLCRCPAAVAGNLLEDLDPPIERG